MATPATAAKLAQLGLRTPADLVLHLPLRYEDETRLTPIADLRAGKSPRRPSGRELLEFIQEIAQRYKAHELGVRETSVGKLKELLSFAVSEQYFRVRQALGISIGEG